MSSVSTGQVAVPSQAGPVVAKARRVGRVQAAVDQGLGALPFLLVWMFFEYYRPPRPFGIPMMTSLALLVSWVLGKKQWLPQTKWLLFLLVVMIAGIPVADNQYSAFWTTREMVIYFLCICIPLQSLMTTAYRARAWVLTFIVTGALVGLWGATHGGYGPSGSDGGQDENYVAALMGMTIPFAYFSIFSEKRFLLKVGFSLAIIFCVAAIALGDNPSRGGFLGLISVALYCLTRSPKKHIGFLVLAVVGVAFMLIAGETFWAEIATTTDYTSGTGNARLEIWKAGFRMWMSNPLIGVGPGNFRWVIGDYQSAEQFIKFGRSLAGSIIAHSSHVEMVAETGTLGLIATAAMTWRTWTDLGKVRDAIPKPVKGVPLDPDLVRIRCYADAIRAAIIAILVNGTFLSLYYYSHLWVLIALGSAFPLVLRSKIPALQKAAPVRRRPSRMHTAAPSPRPVVAMRPGFGGPVRRPGSPS